MSACGSTPTPQPIQIDAAERSVLGELLYSTGISVDELQTTGLGALGNNIRSVAVENGHIVGLRLSEAKWPNLSALSRLPNLRILWLSNNGLTDVSGISGLPLLEELILDDNLLTSLDLRDLPALRSVSVRHNQLPTVPDLGPGVTVNVEGNPAQAILDNPPPAPDSQPQGFVDWLPRRDGQLNGPVKPKFSGSLVENHNYRWNGRWESLTGAALVAVAKIVDEADPTVRAEVTVKAGRVWVYLAAPGGYGYVWAEATPDNPARFTGRMMPGSRLFGALLQSRDGIATDVTLSIRQI